MNTNRYYGMGRDELLRRIERLERRRDELRKTLDDVLDVNEDPDVERLVERALHDPAYVVEENGRVLGGVREIDARSAYPAVRCWRYGAGGALLADEPCEGLTTEIEGEETRASYGARYMIAESMSLQTARAIGRAFGAEVVTEGTEE